MYEPNQPHAHRRSGDAFFSRLSPADLSAHALPTMNKPMPTPPADCNGGTPGMPSLAMVYAPVQEFCGLFPPEKALCEGTLFSGLAKPFCGRSLVRPLR